MTSKYLQKLIDVKSDIKVGELGVETPEVCVVDALEYQGGCLALQMMLVS